MIKHCWKEKKKDKDAIFKITTQNMRHINEISKRKKTNLNRFLYVI
jgi:hypothetical protein